MVAITKELRIMKRVFQIIIPVTVILLAIVGAALADTYAFSYERSATVLNIDEDNNQISLIDNCGHRWTSDNTNFNVGDEVIITIFGYDTDTIADDKITKIKIKNY